MDDDTDDLTPEELALLEDVEDILTDFELNDEVHDLKSQEASAINNTGIVAQFKYILRARGAHHLQELINSYMDLEDLG